MLKKILAAIIISTAFACSVPVTDTATHTTVTHTAVLKTDALTIKIKNGHITKMINPATGKNYLAKGVPAPLLQVRLFKDEGKIVNYAPKSMKWNKKTHIAILDYPKIGVKVKLSMQAKKTHVRFEVLKVTPQKKVELVLWGPYPININRTVGETIGVVQGKNFAIGIQALNIKTLGGYPEDSNSQDVSKDRYIQDKNEYDNIFEKVVENHRMWGNTAWRTKYGAVLQAFCRDRSKKRYMHMGIPNSPGLAYEHVEREPIKDGGVIGSKIALFGCPRKNVLKTIGAIEVAEGLPHPMLNGKWIKTNPDGIATYLAVPYTVTSVDKFIKWAKTAPTVKSLYFCTPGPVSNWGHFTKFRKWAFPKGESDYKQVTDKIKKGGLWVGSHMLSNFITFNDEYVTNVDPRLKSVGHGFLAADINATQTEIPIKNPSKTLLYIGHTNQGKLWPNRIRIGKEIIEYSAVSKKKPYKLLKCKRGNWNTKASAHSKGDRADQLVCDFAYNVTFGNGKMSMEAARNAAAYCNKYGIRIWTNDGIEGNWIEGQGSYSALRFFKEWYDHLTPELQNNVICSASRASHFMWHYVSRYEWGDESLQLRSGMTRYRNMNQSFYERNFLPKFMGGYKLTKDTDLDDVEWFCAIAAGFNAGYSIEVVDPEAMLKNPQHKAITEAMLQWQKARIANAFPKKIKRYLQDPRAEFHLEAIGNGKWKLYPRPNPKDRTQLGKPIIIPVDKPLDAKTLARFIPKKIWHPKVTATGEEGGHHPKYAVDGNLGAGSYWGATPYPQSLTVDLEKPKKLNGVHLYLFHWGKRYYQYTVEVSKDGKKWTMVADRSKNTSSATAEGDKITFDKPITVRYIKVNMLYHNLNSGVHVVEVKWF